MKTINKKFIATSLAALSAVFLFVGCGQKQSEQQFPPMELPVAQIQKGNGLVSKEYPATIEGVSDVEIRPQVSGYLQKILVNEGAYVKAGQALFKIDDRLYAEQLNTAKAAVAVANANLTNATIDLNRKKELLKEQIVSDLQVQQAQANQDASKAALAQAKAAVESARINYQFCTITAPVSGHLGRINFRLGSLISPAGPQPLTILSDNHQVNAYFSMSEVDFFQFQENSEGTTIDEKMKNAMPVGLQVAHGQLYKKKGKIDAIEGQFNATTGSIRFRAKFDNAEGLLRSGNTGKIIIDQEHSDVVLVPIVSTFSIQDQIYIYTLDAENKAVQQNLDVLGKSGLDYYMVRSGVNAGDTYVVSGFERLQAGMPVVPQQNNSNEMNTASGEYNQ